MLLCFCINYVVAVQLTNVCTSVKVISGRCKENTQKLHVDKGSYFQSLGQMSFCKKTPAAVGTQFKAANLNVRQFFNGAMTFQGKLSLIRDQMLSPKLYAHNLVPSLPFSSLLFATPSYSFISRGSLKKAKFWCQCLAPTKIFFATLFFCKKKLPTFRMYCEYVQQ